MKESGFIPLQKMFFPRNFPYTSFFYSIKGVNAILFFLAVREVSEAHFVNSSMYQDDKVGFKLTGNYLFEAV